jgi:hypothetical protein
LQDLDADTDLGADATPSLVAMTRLAQLPYAVPALCDDDFGSEPSVEQPPLAPTLARFTEKTTEMRGDRQFTQHLRCCAWCWVVDQLRRVQPNLSLYLGAPVEEVWACNTCWQRAGKNKLPLDAAFLAITFGERTRGTAKQALLVLWKNESRLEIEAAAAAGVRAGGGASAGAACAGRAGGTHSDDVAAGVAGAGGILAVRHSGNSRRTPTEEAVAAQLADSKGSPANSLGMLVHRGRANAGVGAGYDLCCGMFGGTVPCRVSAAEPYVHRPARVPKHYPGAPAPAGDLQCTSCFESEPVFARTAAVEQAVAVALPLELRGRSDGAMLRSVAQVAWDDVNKQTSWLPPPQAAAYRKRLPPRPDAAPGASETDELREARAAVVAGLAGRSPAQLFAERKAAAAPLPSSLILDVLSAQQLARSALPAEVVAVASFLAVEAKALRGREAMTLPAPVALLPLPPVRGLPARLGEAARQLARVLHCDPISGAALESQLATLKVVLDQPPKDATAPETALLRLGNNTPLGLLLKGNTVNVLLTAAADADRVAWPPGPAVRALLRTLAGGGGGLPTFLVGTPRRLSLTCSPRLLLAHAATCALHGCGVDTMVAALRCLATAAECQHSTLAVMLPRLLSELLNGTGNENQTARGAAILALLESEDLAPPAAPELARVTRLLIASGLHSGAAETLLSHALNGIPLDREGLAHLRTRVPLQTPEVEGEWSHVSGAVSWRLWGGASPRCLRPLGALRDASLLARDFADASAALGFGNWAESLYEAIQGFSILAAAMNEAGPDNVAAAARQAQDAALAAARVRGKLVVDVVCLFSQGASYPLRFRVMLRSVCLAC